MEALLPAVKVLLYAGAIYLVAGVAFSLLIFAVIAFLMWRDR